MAGGTWLLQGAAGELALADVSVAVAPAGAELPPIQRILQRSGGGLSVYAGDLVAPRLITLDLASNRRAAKLPALRAALLPFCRPEAGAISLQYVGLARTLALTCYYLDGLEQLAPRFVAPNPLWIGADVGPLAFPATIDLVGTAAAQPRITLTGSGTATAIGLTTGAYSFTILLGLTLGAGEYAVIDLPLRTAKKYPGGTAILSAVLPGSQLASFALYPGANVLTLTKTGSLTASLTYGARWWSWENADA